MLDSWTTRARLATAALALAAGAAWTVGAHPLATAAAPAGQVDRVALVERWYDARNRGDADTAMAMLAENAVLAHGQCPLATPCVGEANRQFIATSTQHTVVALQEAGSGVVGRVEIRNASTQAAGVDRVLRNVLFQIPRDKIAVYVAIPDLTDPDTARVDGR